MTPVWRQTAMRLRNQRIFKEEFAAWLPPLVLDFHVHILNEEARRGKKFAAAGQPLRKYDFADLRRDLAALYPGRKTLAVCFGEPRRAYDLAANNRYVAQGCARHRLFAFRLFDPAEDPAIVERDLSAGRFLGIKPYQLCARQGNR